jgi:hypothetical protein
MTDRTTKFLARVDNYLATIVNEPTYQSFLRQQIAAWQLRYERFVLTEGASEPVTDRANPPQAADFLLTITGLQARLEQRVAS